MNKDEAMDLAREHGASVESWMTNPPKPGLICMTPEQLHSFAEAAVERERARCHNVVASMIKVVKETERPGSLQSYRDYTANLLEFVADQMIKPSGK